MLRMFRMRTLIQSSIFLALCTCTFGEVVLAGYPDGTLVRASGSAVFEIRNGRKFPVVDTKKIATHAVIDVSPMELAQIPDMPVQTMYGDTTGTPPVPIYGPPLYPRQPAPGNLIMQQRPPTAPMQAGMLPMLSSDVPQSGALPPAPPVGIR